MGVSGQVQLAAALTPTKVFRYKLRQRLGRSQIRCGRCGEDPFWEERPCPNSISPRSSNDT